MDFTQLKHYMNHLTNWRMPGNSIVVYHKGKEVFRYASGYSDMENQIPMQGNELFNIYSCSKVATVVAALQLYERGLFLLDDPVSEYIGEYKHMQFVDKDGNLHPTKQPMTLRHLFCHTSGLTYDLSSKSILSACEKDARACTVDIAKAIAKEPLSFEPGTCWSYSLSHDVLAAVVEVISGERFSDYVCKHIFEPLGASDVYYHRTPDVEKRMAEQYCYYTEAPNTEDIVQMQIHSGNYEGHLKNAGKHVQHVLGSHYDSGGAGITTSVDSYAKFANALATGGKASDKERILSPCTIDLLRTNQLLPEQAQQYCWSQLKGYGYGLGVHTLINKSESGSLGSLGQFGWGGAAGATILVDPEQEFCYFYAHHMLNPQEEYYQPRLRNVAYACLYR